MTMLINGLWLGMLLTLVVWAALKILPGFNAATKHVIWWMTLVAVFVLPFVAVVNKPTGAPDIAPAVVQTAPIPLHRALPPVESSFQPGNNAYGEVRIDQPTSNPKHWETIPITARKISWVIAGIWLTLSLGFAIRLVKSYRWIRQIRASAASAPEHLQSRFIELTPRAGVNRTVALKTSAEIAAPMVLGLTNPTIIIPESLVQNISQRDFDHIALHELAHLARYDDWTNLLQRIAEMLLPIQPGVIFIGRQIALEREAACDDRVVAVAGEARSYASALTRVAELTMWSRTGVLASGTIGRPSQLYRRVARLLGSRRFAAPRVSFAFTGLGVIALAGLLILALHAPQVIAVTDAAPSAPTTMPANPPDQPTSKWYGDLEFEQSQGFTVAPNDRLDVNVDLGNVRITTWDKPRVGIVVRYTSRNNDELKQFLQHHATTMTQSPGVIRLEARGDAWLQTASLQVDIQYEIQTPANMNAKVRDAMGNVDITALSATLDATTAMGNVSAAKCAGTLKLDSAQGNVTISQFSGDWLKAKTAMGNVVAELSSAPKGDCTLHTAMGDVKATLPASAAVNIHTSTAMGNVKSDFDDGANNGGGPTIDLQTQMGNIRVEKE